MRTGIALIVLRLILVAAEKLQLGIGRGTGVVVDHGCESELHFGVLIDQGTLFWSADLWTMAL